MIMHSQKLVDDIHITHNINDFSVLEINNCESTVQSLYNSKEQFFMELLGKWRFFL